MSKTHWITALNRAACGSKGRLKTSTDPDDIDCANCLDSWAFAIGGRGCEDERRGKRATDAS